MQKNNQYKMNRKELKLITKIWWPLAASWLMMAAEQPILTATIARLPNPEINLAAYGGIIFPIALIIEAPIIMLLAASVSLSKDIKSYRKMQKFMMISGFVLTIIHILIAVSPLFYVVTEQIIGAPKEIIEPARMGLILLTPWTWAIAYRRFNQGVLIRYGHSDAVGVGTIIRVSTIVGVMLIGYFTHRFSGAVVAGFAQGMAVLLEAIYAGYRVKPIVNGQLTKEPETEELTWRAFFNYYIPLAMTSFITMLWLPISSMALSRLPNPLPSLAIWPVINGTIFLFRSTGIAYNEVVVALLEKKGMSIHLRQFAGILIGAMTLALGVIIFTPASTFLFVNINALPGNYGELAASAFALSLIIPCLATLQSWYQGAILFGKKTRGIPEANIFSIIAGVLIFVGGYFLKDMTGLYIGMAAYLVTNFVQTVWLWVRSRPIMAQVNLRDQIA
ncbi:MAG: hypothetical protein JEZ00_16950 [Anaerolineaceae bacterium]|nr:hypothetical protein [Anaerolineaceae bacterium]